MSELTQRLAKTLEWPKGYQPDARAIGIISHYEAEIAKGRMSLNVAAGKAVSDWTGSNVSGQPRKMLANLSVARN